MRVVEEIMASSSVLGLAVAALQPAFLWNPTNNIFLYHLSLCMLFVYLPDSFNSEPNLISHVSRIKLWLCPLTHLLTT